MTAPFSYWKGLPARDDDSYLAVIEIPRGDKVKYEYSKELDVLKLDRVLYSSVHYPENYGFFPSTLADDDDPMDVLLLCQEPLDPLTVVECDPIGGLEMIDEKGLDHKIIATASEDPQYNSYEEIDELPPHKNDEIRQFFADYKRLEDKRVEIEEFYPASKAREILDDSIETFRDTYPEATSVSKN